MPCGSDESIARGGENGGDSRSRRCCAVGMWECGAKTAETIGGGSAKPRGVRERLGECGGVGFREGGEGGVRAGSAWRSARGTAGTREGMGGGR